MAVQLEQYVPLPQAAKRLKISSASLQGLIDSGNIRAVKLNGTVAVAESELDHTVAREQFEHLRGHAITIKEAAKHYSVDSETIRKWCKRGYIRVLREGYGAEIDLADVAYCAAVYKASGGTRGKRIFDENGQPCQYQSPYS